MTECEKQYRHYKKQQNVAHSFLTWQSAWAVATERAVQIVKNDFLHELDKQRIITKIRDDNKLIEISTYSSLDDMRRLRLTLNQEQKVKYLSALRLDVLTKRLRIISDFDLLQSTVEEQREALLRAVGKWIDI